jgi:hypothetical protein
MERRATVEYLESILKEHADKVAQASTSSEWTSGPYGTSNRNRLQTYFVFVSTPYFANIGWAEGSVFAGIVFYVMLLNRPSGACRVLRCPNAGYTGALCPDNPDLN